MVVDVIRLEEQGERCRQGQDDHDGYDDRDEQFHQRDAFVAAQPAQHVVANGLRNVIDSVTLLSGEVTETVTSCCEPVPVTVLLQVDSVVSRHWVFGSAPAESMKAE